MEIKLKVRDELQIEREIELNGRRDAERYQREVSHNKEEVIQGKVNENK